MPPSNVYREKTQFKQKGSYLIEYEPPQWCSKGNNEAYIGEVTDGEVDKLEDGHEVHVDTRRPLWPTPSLNEGVHDTECTEYSHGDGQILVVLVQVHRVSSRELDLQQP